MKRSTPTHFKTLRLAKSLGLPVWGAVGLLESLFHLGALYAKRGDIGRLSDEEIAEGIGWTDDPGKLVAALSQCRWLDRCACHRLRIHDWPDHVDQGTERAAAKEGGFIACYKDPSSRLENSSEPIVSDSLARARPSRAVPSLAVTPAGAGLGVFPESPEIVSGNGAVPAISPLREAPEDRVFEYWKGRTGRKTAKFTPDRKRRVKARLAEGHSVEDLFRAVDGYAASAFHQGENERGQRYDDLTLICRDSAHVEQFAPRAGALAPPPTRSPASGAPRPSQAALARQHSLEAFIRGGLLDRQGMGRGNGATGSVLPGSGLDGGDAGTPGRDVPPGPAIPDR